LVASGLAWHRRLGSGNPSLRLRLLFRLNLTHRGNLRPIGFMKLLNRCF
jgi:hypothetical protein